MSTVSPGPPFILPHTMSLLNTKRDVEDLFESAGVSIKEDAINTCRPILLPFS